VGRIDVAQARQFAGACERDAESPGLIKCGRIYWLADDI